MIRKWALLCGGDYYVEGSTRAGGGLPATGPKTLRGCVQDVKSLKDLLIKIGVPRGNIRTLTATVRHEGDGAVEPRDLWPTWHNIQQALVQIENEAKEAGDGENLLFFHFSGHGTLRQQAPFTGPPDGKHKDDFNGTALVMTDVALGGPYLTGRQLGLWIKRMVEKSGFRATVVLDSCFSGDGLRRDDDGALLTPRCLDKLDISMMQVDIDAESRGSEDSVERTRDADVIHKCWLSEPKGCSVITACSRTETASERQFGSETMGVLTYWLVDTLIRFSGMDLSLPSHTRTVDYVRRRVQPNQTPMIYGDGLFQVFSLASYQGGESCTATAGYQSIELNIGSAQGVEVGAVYNAFTREVSPTERAIPGIQHPTQLQVTSVKPFQAQAKLLDPDAAKDWLLGQVRLASLHQWVIPKPVHVQYDGENLDRQLLARELNDIHNLNLENIWSSNRDFHITVNGADDFQISQSAAMIPRLPRISIKDSEWPKKLSCLLSHLSRFQALQDLYYWQYSAKLPESSFKLTTLPQRVQADEKVKLTLTYQGHSSSLWVSLYYFSASWGVEKLWPSSGTAAEHLNKDPFQEKVVITKEVRMRFPPKFRESDPDIIEDQFVFFISTSLDNQVPSWGDICLRSLQPDDVDKIMEWTACSSLGRVDGCNRDAYLVDEETEVLKTEWAVIRQTVETIRRPAPEDFS
ncbi:caspase domain-containing protein [Fusarium circinatum]|uniref:Caspase domain-containing protein n=1 Tax=Fusarium circinatum TaxID=48490 RepID=A0A8H5T3K5_FUSCI|nr:caspase domain-containing protein [Fusarium circinatum]